jgi:hypothetical protein
MNETAADLEQLQTLLDSSYERAGTHLTSIHTPERRLSAQELCGRLTGMTLLVLATATRDGRPLTGPVDGIFHRGHFWFGSSPTSLRARHLAERPEASVTHLPGEHLGVTAHGRVVPAMLAIDVGDDFAQACVDIYGETWRDWGADAVYWKLAADRLFTFHLDPDPRLESADSSTS